MTLQHCLHETIYGDVYEIMKNIQIMEQFMEHNEVPTFRIHLIL